MRSHARAPLHSPAAACLFHPAELFPTINFNLAWSLPLQPGPPWGLGLGKGRWWLPQPAYPQVPAPVSGAIAAPFLGLSFLKIMKWGGEGSLGSGLFHLTSCIS